MAPPLPSLTNTWHTDTYAAINPLNRPELSLKGKTVIISGGGAGIGKGLSRAFADAGAATIAILGRRKNLLQDTKREIEADNRDVAVDTYTVDIVDLAAVQQAAKKIGKWDVLVSNAGYLSDVNHLVESNPEDWWKAFEVNVKGTFNLAHSFLPNQKPNAVFIGVNAGSIQVPVFAPNFSSYNCSKLAAVKLLEALAAENPELHVVSMHPGVVESEMSAKVQAGKENVPTFDSVELPGHFAVWLCNKEARFLRGKFAWCNWDVEELQERKAEIEGSLLLTSNIIGWPYSP